MLLMRCIVNELHNHKLTGLSQNLRRDMTKEEKHLWYDYLRKLPYTLFRFQTQRSFRQTCRQSFRADRYGTKSRPH
ncbi:MAG: DUF559 domain-containing protein, partial [Clostridia bacterium]|nr:DUF559 domain-containing protein [Clostridia bacterium]